MSIFNSLGSNYDFGFALRNFLKKGKDGDTTKLKNLLEQRYGGEALLTYKGREALRLALRIIGKSKEYKVGICGFTCFVVYEAIIKEGYKVEYLDIEKNSLNFSLETLKSAFKKNPKLKIVFIQNTLGYPCDIENISKFCKQNNIILLEDLAHSIGTKYSSGKEAGTIGDFVMLSFSQDKVIDGVSGGALIVKSSKIKVESLELKDVSLEQQNKDRLYPLFTFLIRKLYCLGIGKSLHFFLKKINTLSNPMNFYDMNRIHSLPQNYAKSIYLQFLNLEKSISRRQKNAEIYSKLLNKKILFQSVCDSINNSSNLRFPIFAEDRLSLVNFLKKSGVFVSDIWYDVPIAPKRYLEMTDYKKGECPNSENVSKKILNLPTHRNISEKDARFIVGKINLWLK